MENDHYKSAFPTHEGNHLKDYSDPGMTLRDYFAASAMQGWLASYGSNDGAPKADTTARMAYEFADAMLRAREAS